MGAPKDSMALQASVQKRLRNGLLLNGGEIEEEQELYVRATFPGFNKDRDVFEFLFVPDDTTVSLRAVPTGRGLFTQSRLRKTLEKVRISLGWENVYILRNRKRLFGVVESPFDTFGDAAPSGDDVSKILQDCGQDCNQPLD